MSSFQVLKLKQLNNAYCQMPWPRNSIAAENGLVIHQYNRSIDEMFSTLARWLAPRREDAAAARDLAAGNARLHSLPGVNATAALARMRSNEALFERMLLRFLKTDRDFVSRFSDTWAQGHRDDARRMAHDLQAVAGTLGMHGLREAALSLEQACGANDASAVRASLQEVSEQIEPILQGLETWAASRQRESADPA